MFYIGLDLGQAADYSALAIVEELVYVPPAGGWVSPSTLDYEQSRLYEQLWYKWRQQTPEKPPLWLRTLHRYPLRTSYPDVVNDVIQRLGGTQQRYRGNVVLVVDGTGVGAPVVDMFRYGDLPCEMVKVVIHGGVKVIHDRGTHVPKRDLIGAVQVALHTGRLRVAKQSDMTDVWFKEMQNYHMKQTDTGHDSYNARQDSIHDDLVLAVSLAIWLREYRNRGE